MASRSKRLFLEAEPETIFKSIENYCQNTNVKDWQNLDVVCTISKEYAMDDTAIIKDKMKQILCQFWSSKESMANQANVARKKAAFLKSYVEYALDSTPFAIEMKKNETRSQNTLYKESVRCVTVVDKNNEVQTELRNQSKKRASMTEQGPSSSKKQHIHAKELSDLSKEEQLKVIVREFGKDGTLDTRMHSVLPQRLDSTFKSIEDELQFPLKLSASKEELEVILQINQARGLKEIGGISDSISITTKSPGLRYIKLALTKLCFLWQTETLTTVHNEDWYRVNVFGDLLDAVFLTDKGYETKRSECHSSIIKWLRAMEKLPEDQPNVKLDFIVKSTGANDLGDVFIAEDKGKYGCKSTLNKDTARGDFCRTQALRYWNTLLPHDNPLNRLEAISSQSHCLEFSVTGTTMLATGELIHYAKHTTNIPKTPDNGSSTAMALLTFLSLKRTILKNLQRLQLIFEVIDEDTVQYLVPRSSINRAKLFIRQNSTSSGSSSGSVEKDDWKAEEKARRLRQKLKEKLELLELDDDSLTYSNWEELTFAFA